MFTSILKWFFYVEQKTPLEDAIEEILSYQTVNNHGLCELDPVSGIYYILGSDKKKTLFINFSSDDKEVVLKRDGEHLYYFGEPGEVQDIRNCIILNYNKTTAC